MDERAISSEGVVAALDAAWGDPHAWTRDGLHWTHHPLVRAAINRRVTGNPLIDPLAWAFSSIAQHERLPLERTLVLGCGGGAAEVRIGREGWSRETIAFDLSPKVLEGARARAAGAAGVSHVVANMDALPLGTPPFGLGQFDAIVGISSVHHSRRMEGLFDDLHALLKPGGWLFLDEYVGPDRFQWPSAQVDQLRLLADLLPDALRRTAQGAIRSNYRAPEVDAVIAIDPTEAAQSSRILEVARRKFELIECRPYGGSLLNPLLASITQNFLDAEGQRTIQLLIEAEDELERLGRLPQDFACALARARRVPVAAAPESTARSN